MAKVSRPLNWTDKTYFCCAVTLYGIAMVYSVFLWRKGFQRDDWVVYGVLAGGLVLHTVAMAKRGFNLQASPDQQSLRSNGVYHVDHCRRESRGRHLAAVPVCGGICISFALCVGGVHVVSGYGSGISEWGA